MYMCLSKFRLEQQVVYLAMMWLCSLLASLDVNAKMWLQCVFRFPLYSVIEEVLYVQSSKLGVARWQPFWYTCVMHALHVYMYSDSL